jgi:DNA modification methylase
VSIRIIQGDCREMLATLPDASVHCVVTSPPYWGLRDYGTGKWDGGDPACDHLPISDRGSRARNGLTGGTATIDVSTVYRARCGKCGAVRVDRQIGLETTPDVYVAEMVAVFREVQRVLRNDGTLWLNLGSSYARDAAKGQHKPGDSGKSNYIIERGGGRASVQMNLASGGKRPNRSRQPSRALACDNGGKELRYCSVPGCACCDPDGEYRDGSPNHRVDSEHTDQLRQRSALPVVPKVHDIAHRDYVGAFPDASLLGVPSSTNLSSLQSEPPASCLGDEVLAFPQETPTTLPESQAFVHRSACIDDTTQSVRLSTIRNLDKALSDSACGCGSCGICWAYLAIPLLRFKSKDLIDIPTLVALALQADGWYLRSDIIWSKPNPMPESVFDRPSSAHEKVYLLAKSPRYFYDAEAVREAGITTAEEWESKSANWRNGEARQQQRGSTYHPYKNAKPFENGPNPAGRNLRNVWTIATAQFNDWQQTVHQVRVAWDAPGDGKKRITSPDCPLHGDRPDRVPNAACGEHVIDPDGDSAHIANHPVPKQQGDCVPTETRHARETVVSTSGSQVQSCVEPATPHSTQSHRTVLAHATNLSCMPCEETLPHIAGRSEEPDCSDSADRMLSNSSAPDGSGDHPSVQTPPHNADIFSSDNSQCTCEYYIEKTEKTSHFATFPPELAERCIKAGTSEKGACAACGSPWRRVTTKGEPDIAHRATSGADACGGYNGQSTKDHDAHGVQNASDVKRRILEGMRLKEYDWQPSCQCGAKIVPCVVLDCFSGAGTALMVADRLQRDAIGIELNSAYADMSRTRLTRDAGLFADLQETAP